MIRTQIVDYFLYRYRYVLGYGFLILLLGGQLVISTFIQPNGLREAERLSATHSANLSLTSLTADTIINLPYHVLQKLSIYLFGFTEFSIKLPSLALALLTSLGIVILLSMWFKRNNAIATAAIMMMTSQFLFISQDGTPLVLFIFLSIWLFIFAMLVSRRWVMSTVWKVGLFTFAALMLYVPLGIYLILALATAALLHPHLRYILRHMSAWKITLSALLALGILTPLIFALINTPSIGLQLLGVPPSMPDIKHNVISLFTTSFGVYATSTDVYGAPIYRLGVIMLMIAGVYYLLTAKYTARSYIVWTWILLISPFIILNPQYVNYTFIIATLIVGMGTNFIISSWYSLFPRNPYARVSGLLLIGIVVIGIISSSINSYFHTYAYTRAVRSAYNHDLSLTNAWLTQHANQKRRIVVSQQEEEFYRAATRKTDTEVTVSAAPAPGLATLASRSANRSQLGIPDRILTSALTHDSNRLYTYKTLAN